MTINKKNEEISETIISIISNRGAILAGSEEQKYTYRYLDAGDINSLEIMGFIIEIEDAFKITLSPEDTQSDLFRTIGGLIEIVSRKLNGEHQL